MHDQNSGLVPIAKKKVSFKPTDRCKFCDELLLEKGKLKLSTMYSEDAGGLVHDGCFMPYHKEEDISVLFKVRAYSMGDVITTTPMLRELKRIHPRVKVTVMTLYPDLFKYNPNVNSIIDMNKQVTEPMVLAHHFSLDAFKTDTEQPLMHFSMHSMDFTSISTFHKSVFPIFWDYEVYYSPEDKKKAIEVLGSFGVDIEKDKVILINPHKTEWETRDWGPFGAQQLVDRIQKEYPEFKIVSVGGSRKEVPTKQHKNYVKLSGDVIDLYERFSLLESIALMDLPCMKLMITPDTGSLHLAACTKELPIVAVFTLIKKHFRTPVRQQQYSYKFIGVQSEDPCCCTYNAAVLTTAMNFAKCPKREFIVKTQQIKMKNEVKAIGLSNALPEFNWNENDLNNQMNSVLKKYDPEALPCFPAVDRVFAAVERALKEWT